MPSLDCPYCKKTLELSALLAGLDCYSPSTHHFSAPCPLCRAWIEFQVQSGKLVVGYTYWSGSMHFEGMIDVPVAGIKKIAATSPPGIRLGAVEYSIRPPPA